MSTITQPETLIRPKDENWDLIIEPQRSLFDLRLGELWRYRDLVMLFVRRDFVAVYKQTILGPLWYLIQPLFTTITFTVIFGQIARLSTDGLPQFLFYMSGTVIWTYFAECITKTSNTFVQNAHLFGKVTDYISLPTLYPGERSGSLGSAVVGARCGGFWRAHSFLSPWKFPMNLH